MEDTRLSLIRNAGPCQSAAAAGDSIAGAGRQPDTGCDDQSPGGQAAVGGIPTPGQVRDEGLKTIRLS